MKENFSLFNIEVKKVKKKRFFKGILLPKLIPFNQD